ncbi:MAG: hypothetical protein EAZ53_10035 [Bacteroidetes bacterium]|nr:MAG: hypothetical protein EAZ53_10035 [Bacteroidota bacterium]
MKTVRIFAVIISILVFSILTFLKSQPIKTFEKNFASFFNQKPNWGAEKYPTSFSEFNKLGDYSYKWGLTFFFTFFYIASTYLLIYGLFANKKALGYLHFIYLLLFFLIGIFATIGLISHRFDIGFGVVQYLKRLIQGIYLAMFFVIYFWKIAPLKK